jgi:hypothetical protein
MNVLGSIGGYTPPMSINSKRTEAGDKPATGRQQLSEQEQRQLAELRARDREVRAHERAHLLAAGRYANGGPQYDLTRGPDGRYYATGGSVSIDTSPEPGDPQATIDKAEQVKRAALAPAQPSGQDLQVAAQAEAMRVKAQTELRRQQLERAESGQAGGVPQAPSGARSVTALASYQSVSAMA